LNDALDRRAGLEIFGEGVIRSEDRLQQRQALRLPFEAKFIINAIPRTTPCGVMGEELLALVDDIVESLSNLLLNRHGLPRLDFHCFSQE
jgi:hypothetical protein